MDAGGCHVCAVPARPGDAEPCHSEQDSNNPKFKSWRSPFTGSFGRIAAGELTARGADEMRALGQRIRSYFPALLDADYFPTRYNIVSSQVPCDPSLHRCMLNVTGYTCAAISLPATGSPFGQQNHSSCGHLQILLQCAREC